MIHKIKTIIREYRRNPSMVINRWQVRRRIRKKIPPGERFGHIYHPAYDREVWFVFFGYIRKEYVIDSIARWNAKRGIKDSHDTIERKIEEATIENPYTCGYDTFWKVRKWRWI